MKRHQVLVVDDDKNMCELLAEGLDASKFEVVWTTDPRAGEELIARREFDVVLTDVRMGQLNGFELCSRLVQRQRGLPVVVMTALRGGNVRELANCMEHAAVLARGNSVEKSDLRDKVRELSSPEPIAEAQAPDELPSLEEVERRYILRVFEAVRGNKSQAALVLGLDRKTLYRRLERYGMLRTDSSRTDSSRAEASRSEATRSDTARPEPAAAASGSR